MEKKELVKRYLIFLAGLFVNALGVAFVTKADLGTSPISSIPYVLSMKFPWTIGQFTIAFSLLLVGMQIVLLRKKFQAVQLLQIPVSILFGYLIDFSMDTLLYWMKPEHYAAKLMFLAVGCIILGFGVFLEVLGNVVMLPGEGVTRAISQCLDKDFGTIKVTVDVSMCVIALLLSLILFHEVRGVREGTIAAALLVGFLSRTYGKIFTGKRVKRKKELLWNTL